MFGDLVFMKDDPGRQTIGSFNPLTDDDWTDIAYIGNTQELCQKICDGDLDFVESWCERNPESVDRRDHTGRTPLHIAAQCSTPEILECLVDHGARIVARLVDGMTALHIAAARGSVEMVNTLLEQSEENEAEEAEKEEKKKVVERRKVGVFRFLLLQSVIQTELRNNFREREVLPSSTTTQFMVQILQRTTQC